MKVAIVGSRRYENKKKIKDFVFKLKEQYGTDTIIVSGGCKQGADKYAKKYALELGLQYEEYPPFHEVHNLYCSLPESRYDKPFSMRNFFARNKIIAGTSDFIVAFIPEGVEANGTKNVLEYAKKLNKKRIMTLQKLTNRSVDRFLTDEKFREEIETYDNLIVSGSNF